MQKVPPTYRVSLAVRTIAAFCAEKQVEFDLDTAVHVALAFARGKTFEWTPSQKAFRRIYFSLKQEGDRITSFVLVLGYDGENPALTTELNARIHLAAGDRWS